MEKKHIHVHHSRLSSSASLRNCRGSESRFHLSVILFFGVFSICLLIGLLVANAQYNDAKRQLTEDLQVSKKTLASKRSEINQLKETLDKKSTELKRALSAQKFISDSDPKCNANEELQRDLTERLLACNESLSTITKERDWLNNRLVESLRKGIDGGSSEQNNSMFNMTEGNELSALLINLTASRQENNSMFNMTEGNELSALLINLTASRQENATCPYDWKNFNSSCYLVSGNGSWDEGRKDCMRKGGDLVVINNPEEQNYLAEFKHDAWIGLSDRETEGSWLWVDGAALSFMSWSVNQPDNGGGDPIWGEEDCAYITPFDGAPWNDVSCNATKQWICEKIPTMFAP